MDGRRGSGSSAPRLGGVGVTQGQIDDLFANQVKGVLEGLSIAQLDDVIASMTTLDPTVAALAVAVKENTKATEEAAKKDAGAGTAAGVVSSLAEYARSLTTSDAAAGTVLDRFNSAQEIYESTSRAAAGGDADAIRGFQAASDTYLGLAKQVYGGGAGYADVVRAVTTGLTSIADRGPEALTQDFMRDNAKTNTDRIVGAVERLEEENKNLRRDIALLMDKPR